MDEYSLSQEKRKTMELDTIGRPEKSRQTSLQKLHQERDPGENALQQDKTRYDIR